MEFSSISGSQSRSLNPRVRPARRAACGPSLPQIDPRPVGATGDRSFQPLISAPRQAWPSYLIDSSSYEVPLGKYEVSQNNYVVEFKASSLDSAATPTDQLQLAQSVDVSNVPSYPLVSAEPLHGTFGWYESLVACKQTNYYSCTGSYLEQLQAERDRLTILLAQQTLDLDEWFQGADEDASDACGIDPAFDPSDFDPETVLAYIEQAAQDPAPVAYQPIGVVKLLITEAKTNRVLWKLTKAIRGARKLISRTVSRFCCLSWFRRHWFLLHGSHPPKCESWLSACQVFGVCYGL